MVRRSRHGRRPLSRRQSHRPGRSGADPFQAIFAHTLDAVCIFDDHRRYRVVNPAACQLFGESQERLLCRRLGDQAVPGQAAQFQHAWQVFWDQGHLQGEFQILRADGTVRTVEFNAQAHILPHHHLAVLRDITAQKAAESLLRQSEERFAKAFRASPILGALIHLASTQVVDVNDSGLRFCGQPRATVVGHTIRTPRLWVDVTACDRLFAHLQQTGTVRDFEATLRTTSGVHHVYSLAAEVLTLGGEAHALLIGQDITERHQAATETAAALAAQQAAHARLWELHALQTELVATLRHEFRTPLTAIQGFAALLRGEAFTPTQVQEYAETIHAEALRLGRLVTDLLSTGHPGHASSPRSYTAVDLNALLRTCSARLQLSAPAHPITLRLDPTGPCVLGDADRLTQVVLNLLDNAIKYSPAGGPITVRSTRVAQQVQMQVTDQGIGLPTTALERIFERYSRLPLPAGATIPGTGLGLAIVRDIIRQHGGTVQARSAPDRGTTITVTLPAEP